MTIPAVDAQVKARITSSISDEDIVSVRGSVSARLAMATDLGRIDANQPMQRMLLRLEPSDEQKSALSRFIDDQHNPKSPIYHKWLKPEEFAAQFGPAEQDKAAVASWLVSKGFLVAKIARGGRYIEFSGTAGNVEAGFHTEMHRYKLQNGETHFANSKEISLPRAIASVAKGVVSLNNFKIPAPIHAASLLRRSPSNGKVILSAMPVQSSGLKSLPQFNGADGTNFLTPGDLSTIYDSASVVKAGITGSGVSIAVVGRSNIQLSDVETFRTLFGLRPNDPKIILDGPDPGTYLENYDNYDDQIEASLDVEYAGALAPDATIQFVPVASTQTTDGVSLSAAYIVENAIAPIMSVSFGLCEALTGSDSNAFNNSLWEQAAAEGITVLVSAGDQGSAACDGAIGGTVAYEGLSVSGTASTPYNVAVGGTEFNEGSNVGSYWNAANAADLSSAIGYIPEAAWNESCDSTQATSSTNCAFSSASELGGGGGGVSSCLSASVDTSVFPYTITCTGGGYPKPSWQTGRGVPVDGVRDLPDISLASASAHDPILICFEASCQYTTGSNGAVSLDTATAIGGTSAAAPQMASILALVEQKYGTYLGLINYTLYSLAAGQSSSACNASNETSPGTATACIFHDVTAGSIAVPCAGATTNCSSTDPSTDGILPGYDADAGYDLATGLGSIDVANLVANWGNAATKASITTLSTNLTSFTHGTAITVTTKVAPSAGTGTPSGDVGLDSKSTTGTTMANGASDMLTLINGSSSGSVNDLPGGTYNLYARYAGDATYSPSTSLAVSLTVAPESSVTTLFVSEYVDGATAVTPVTSAAFGTVLYIDTSVAGASGNGTPTGTVSLYDGTTKLGDFALSENGSIEIPLGQIYSVGNAYGIVLAPGIHNLKAVYAGDSSFKTSTSTTSFTVNKGTLIPQLLLTPSGSVNTGETIMAQVVLVSYSPGVTPTGKVTITDNGTAVTTATLTADSAEQISLGGSVAMASFSLNTVGSHTISFIYAGDANFAAPDLTYLAAYGTQTLTVTKPTLPVPKVTITQQASIVPLGGGSLYTVNVTGSGVTPTGNVTLEIQYNFYDLLWSVPPTVVLNAGGGATISYTWLQAEPGAKIMALYSGDSSYAPSTSNILTTEVSQATPSITVSTPTGYVLPDAQASVTVNLSSPLLSEGTLVAASANLMGMVQLYDSFNGTTTAIGIPHQTVYGQGYGSKDTSVVTIPVTLAAGAHVLSARFLGNPNYAATTSTNSVTIIASTPDYALTVNSPKLAITAGDTGADMLTVTPILGYDAAVSFTCGGLPAGTTCVFSPSTIVGTGSSTLSIATTAPSSSAIAAQHNAPMPHWASLGAGMVALALTFGFGLPSRRRRAFFLALLLTCILGFNIGCGGGGVSVSSLELQASSLKVASGSNVTLSAVLSSNRNPPYSGAVTFYDQTTNSTIGVPTGFIGNTAQLDVGNLSVGTHQIYAKYSGDNHISPSQSRSLSVTITGMSTVTVTSTSGALMHAASVAVTIQ